METLYVILLRVVHVFAGLLWVGGSVIYVFYIEPSVKASGPAGQQFMQNFMGKLRFSNFMNIASGLTVVAGALLYWRDAGGQIGTWIQTGPGLGFTLGSIAAIIVYLIGFFMIRPRADRLGALGRQVGMAGGPPTSEQAAELGKLGQEMETIGRVDFVLLSVSLILMATARYWVW